MQDPYSAMMHSRDDRFFRPYGPRSNIPTSSYYGMAYSAPSHTMTHGDLSGLMSSSVSPSSGLSSSVLPHTTLPNSAIDYTNVSGVNSSNGHDVQQLLHQSIATNSVLPTTDDHIPKTNSQHLHIPDLSSPVPTSPPISNSSSIKAEGNDVDNELSSPSSTGSGPSTPLDLASDMEGNFRMPPKKRPHNVPDNQKDDTYWEKRKKNNDSAKRSREARRMKEEQIALRVVFLEQENLQLRTEVSLLKTEIEKLRCMLYNP